MAPLDFEILSKLMRYIFTFLGALIVWRSFAWLRKDRRATHKRLKALPDAGTIGVMMVLRGSTELREGASIPVPYEGVLGFVRSCDVVVPVTDVTAQHLDFTFRNGKGLFIYPRRGCPVAVDGVAIRNAADARHCPMHHGSVLAVGEALLQLCVFAGLDVKQTAGQWEEAPAMPTSVPMPYPPQEQPDYPPVQPPQPAPEYPAVAAPAYPPLQQPGYPPLQPPQPMPAYPPAEAPAYPRQSLPYPPPPAFTPPEGRPLPPGILPQTPLNPPERRPDDEA